MGGAVGQKFKEEIEQRIKKLLEPPPIKKDKALPRPDDKVSKKRGGKRFRKMKERYERTEIRKQQNRVSFGVAEEEAFGGTDVTVGLGMMGQSGVTGKVRAAAVKTKGNKVSKTMNKRLGLTSASSGATGGLSSTVAMTPTTGM